MAKVPSADVLINNLYCIHTCAPTFDNRQRSTKQMTEYAREQVTCWLAVYGISKAALHLSEELFFQLESPALVGDRVNREMANISTLQHHLQAIMLAAEMHNTQSSNISDANILKEAHPMEGLLGERQSRMRDWALPSQAC